MNKFIEVKTWEDCCAEIEGIRRANPTQVSKLLFRGLSDSAWKLSTTLERRSGGRNFTFKDYYRLVRRVRSEIETESGLRWDVPSFEEISSWAGVYDQTHYEMMAYEYLAHLRHNGFPSPLLDWSRSPYVAAYFAFSGAASTDAAAIYVYLEKPEGMKVSGSGAPGIRMLGQYVRTHKRHFRQQSAYTVCANYEQSDFDNSYQAPKGLTLQPRHGRACPGHPRAHQCANDVVPVRDHSGRHSQGATVVAAPPVRQQLRPLVSYIWRFVSHETVFDMQQPTAQDLLWKIVVPSSERSKVLMLLDEFNLNAYSLFGSEESLMETLAYREIDAKLPL